MSRFQACRPLAVPLFAAVVLLSALAGTSAGAPAQGPPPAVREAVSAVVAALESTGDTPLQSFAAERLSAAYRDGFAAGGLLEHLRSLREAARGSTGDLGVERTPDGLLLVLSGDREVRIRMQLDPGSGEIGLLEFLNVGEADPGTADQQSAVRAHERGFEGLMQGPEVYAAFAGEHLSEELRQRLDEQELYRLLDQIRNAFAQAGAVSIQGGGEGITLGLRGGVNLDVLFTIEDQPPFLIRSLRVDTEVAPEETDDPELPPFNWDTLEARLDEVAEEGFAGTVLAIRGGETVVDGSWGQADRRAGRANHSETIYGIGSVPFDFTRGAVYLLMERGALDLDDPITRFLPEVPDDKRAITVRHLLGGRSGLANFHGRPEDADPDLTWIDRLEAERRILDRPLLFEPGSDRAVSHSAFGLLAAIVERVSGITYAEFLSANFFGPAGMQRTGFYGEYLDHESDDFAVGYGQQAGIPNIPPEWGRVSWLVMGSGGMYSTPADLKRWSDYMRTSGALSGGALEGFLDRGSATGGSDRGFMALMAWGGETHEVYMASNSADDYGLTRAVLRRLRELVTGGA